MPMADPSFPKREPSASDHPGVPRENARAELPERATPSSIGHIPEESSGRPTTKEGFTVIRGGASESAKAKVSDAVEQAREQAGEFVDKARQKGEELVDKARVKGGELADQAREKGQELREKGKELKEQAEVRFQEARSRAEQMARSNPLRFIGAAAVVGVVLGIFLRLWRDHHAG